VGPCRLDELGSAVEELDLTMTMDELEIAIEELDAGTRMEIFTLLLLVESFLLSMARA
jgi:hypothetical protein